MLCFRKSCSWFGEVGRQNSLVIHHVSKITSCCTFLQCVCSAALSQASELLSRRLDLSEITVSDFDEHSFTKCDVNRVKNRVNLPTSGSRTCSGMEMLSSLCLFLPKSQTLTFFLLKFADEITKVRIPNKAIREHKLGRWAGQSPGRRWRSSIRGMR